MCCWCYYVTLLVVTLFALHVELLTPITITLCKWCVVNLVGCWSIMLLICHIVVHLMLSNTHHHHSPFVLLLFHRIISCCSYCITCITMKYYPPIVLCKWWSSIIIKNKEKKNEFFHSFVFFFFKFGFLPFFLFFKKISRAFFFVVSLKEFSQKFNINQNTFNFYLHVFVKQIGKTI